MRKLLSVLAAGSLLAGCADAGTTKTADGPQIDLNIAALQLDSIQDVVWDIQVVNGDSTGVDIVWNQRIKSSQYGNGSGSASYVGPCDADTTNSAYQNTVRLWVVGIYKTTLSGDPGAFNYGRSIPGSPEDFQNPTTPSPVAVSTVAADIDHTNPAEYGGPLTKPVNCEENKDVFVQFDISLMRPAQQGFFDIAVNFNNIFCSAKFDCAYQTDGTCSKNGTTSFCYGDSGATATTCTTDANCNTGEKCYGTCAGGETALLVGDFCYDNHDCAASGEQINLLHAVGDRAKTFVLGFACTAGTNSSSVTELYMDDLSVTCDGMTTTVEVNPKDVNGNPTDGNLCSTVGAYDDAGTHPVCTSANTGDNIGTNRIRVCTGGTNAGKACDDVGTDCPGGTCTAATGSEPHRLFQAAVYRGDEQLGTLACANNPNGSGTTGTNRANGSACSTDADCGAGICTGDLHKAYWNVALGISDHALTGCTLTTKATANDFSDDHTLKVCTLGADAGEECLDGTTCASGNCTTDNPALLSSVQDEHIPAKVVYPIVKFSVPLDACFEQPLSFKDGARVQVTYTKTDGTLEQFGNAYPDYTLYP